jgi:hypothetical protein
MLREESSRKRVFRLRKSTGGPLKPGVGLSGDARENWGARGLPPFFGYFDNQPFEPFQGNPKRV